MDIVLGMFKLLFELILLPIKIALGIVLFALALPFMLLLLPLAVLFGLALVTLPLALGACFLGCLF